MPFCWASTSSRTERFFQPASWKAWISSMRTPLLCRSMASAALKGPIAEGVDAGDGLGVDAGEAALDRGLEGSVAEAGVVDGAGVVGRDALVVQLDEVVGCDRPHPAWDMPAM